MPTPGCCLAHRRTHSSKINGSVKDPEASEVSSPYHREDSMPTPGCCSMITDTPKQEQHKEESKKNEQPGREEGPFHC